MASCNFPGVLNAQFPAANQGDQKCIGLAETNLAATYIKYQTEALMLDHAQTVIGLMATIRETQGNSDTIVVSRMEKACMMLSAEGGPCAYTAGQLKGFLFKGSDKKKSICVSEKALNRGETDILDQQTNIAAVALTRSFMRDLVISIKKLHKSSSKFKPYGNRVSDEALRQQRMQCFNSLSDPVAFAKATSTASSHIRKFGIPRVMAIPGDARPLMETTLVTMNANFVGDDGYLLRSGNTGSIVHSYGGLTVVETAGDECDELVGEARVPSHVCNAGTACDSGRRTVQVVDHTSGNLVSLNLDDAVENMRAFDASGNVSNKVKTEITKYQTKGQTKHHIKWDLDGIRDPWRKSTFGIWSHMDIGGKQRVSTRLGDSAVSRPALQSFASSVIDIVGIDVVPLMKRCEGILKRINRQAPTAANYMDLLAAANGNGELTPTNPDESGNLRDARGNNWGVLNHPATVAANAAAGAFQVGYATG